MNIPVRKWVVHSQAPADCLNPNSPSFGINPGMIAVMFHKLISAAAWTWLAYIAFATLSPVGERPHVASVHLEHVIAFAILGMLFSLAYPRRTMLVCIVVLGSAVLLELLQLLTPDRHGRLPDAIEKMAGGAVGIILGRAVSFFKPVKRGFRR